MGTWTYLAAVYPPASVIKQTFTQSLVRGYYDEHARYDEYNDYTVSLTFDNFRLNGNDVYCDYVIGVEKQGRTINKDTHKTTVREFSDNRFTSVILLGGIDILHNESTVVGVPFPLNLGNVQGSTVDIQLVAEYDNIFKRSSLIDDVEHQTDYWNITITVPTFVEINAPTLNSYTKNIPLNTSGYYDYNFNVLNPDNYTYHLNHDNDILIAETTAASQAVNFRWRKYPDGSSNTYNYDITLNYPTHTNQYEYYYFKDQNDVTHDDRAGALTTVTYQLPFTIVDNDNVFTINNSTVLGSRSYQDVDVDIYAVDNTKFKLTYNITYNDITDTTTKGFNIKLYDSGNPNKVYINTYVTIASGFPKTASGILYSEIFTQSAELVPAVDITPYQNESSSSHNSRKRTKTFDEITIYAYTAPSISFFDAFPSNSAGDSDLTSPHATYLSQYKFSSCGGWNSITAQRFDISYETDESTIIQTYNNPGLVSGTAKYIADITYNTSRNYIIKFYITDRFGRTTSKKVTLRYSGGVIMDFNKTGYGMAIGKYSESDILEINLPTVFYNDVEYISGKRLTTDVARDLGCSDPYAVGATNIQEMLDYLVNKVLNG